MKSKAVWIVCFLVLAACAGQRGLPPREGIRNFAKVNEQVYRGAQPDQTGISNLKRLGVRSIINLRMPTEAWGEEETLARLSGMVYTNLPMSGMSRPSEEQVSKALALLETLPGPVFVHCHYGCDRTGAIIACYRIKHDRWLGRYALLEADYYGMYKAETGLRDFVIEFGTARK